MSKQLAPFHFDIVGSFLRPEELKEARKLSIMEIFLEKN